MSQGSIETSLIRPRGETSLSTSLEAPPIPNSSDCSVLIVGEFGDGLAGLEATLGQLGASVKVALAGDTALALLEHEPFACMLIDAALPEEQSVELLRHVHLDPRKAKLPILLLTSDLLTSDLLTSDLLTSDLLTSDLLTSDLLTSDLLTSDLLTSDFLSSDNAERERPHGELGKGDVLLAHRGAPGLLAGQLGVLLELHRSRVRGLGLEAQLEYAKSDLKKTSEDNASLADQARRATAELETAQAQLVQAAKLAALGELVAGVAHEINNPLSFSLSHMTTLRRGINKSLAALGELAPETRSESARLEERLVGVTLGLDRIKSLVVKLQTFSRLDDGKSQSVDVADAIGTVLTILHHRMRDRIQVTTEFGKPNTIVCDPSLVNQCVMNLVVNAIDAIDGQDEEASIHISARGEGESYVIRVIDSGHGVAPEIEHKIFDPFFTTKPVGKGTGLGLSIASSVIRKHDGTLTLSPGTNGGTEAVIRIPVGRVAAARRR